MTDLSGITAVVLAGGMGTRLREVVADRPKVMAEVNNRPFITYLLDQLADAGVARVVLCTGYMADLVSTVLGCSYRGMQLQYSAEPAPLGTGGAIRLAMPLYSSFPLLVLNGDSYFDLDLISFTTQHIDSGSKVSLALATVSDVSRYGAVEIAADNAITSFEEKGSRQGPGLINAGIYLLEQAAVETMPPDIPVSIERELFPSLIGHGLYGFAQSGKFLDIGVPADYQAAAAFFKD
jgi:D-glycero-alpha-D-manno-heptose 1-phosphate guanylyltransferase